MNHIYISPHFDDAIFSAGGLILRQRQRGERVSVVTTCGGKPDYSQLSPFAASYHQAWGNPADPVAERAAEDKNILQGCGVDAYHLNTPDSIYREYPDLPSLFSTPLPMEVEIIPLDWMSQVLSLFQLHVPTPDVTLYAPLAAGGHVDHQLARMTGLYLHQAHWIVWFYEDFPHAEGPGLLQAALDSFGLVKWQHQILSINIQAKLRAMDGYISQIPFLFGSTDLMHQRQCKFSAERAEKISHLERLRLKLAGRDGRRARVWRKFFGYHAHAESFWRLEH